MSGGGGRFPGSYLVDSLDEQIDEVAMALVASGKRRVGLTRVERAELCRRMLAEGLPPSTVRYRIGLSPRVFDRLMEDVRVPA